jgi:hypothetical protein
MSIVNEFSVIKQFLMKKGSYEKVLKTIFKIVFEIN